ncbi:MAG: hypothetical protein FWB80_10570 [Defluviitaleaceae bacterium]|nr:hypothetical protein [Defluviitaleaceae bacterium]
MMFYHASNIEGLKKILPLSESKNKEEKDKVAYFTPVRLYALSYLRDMDVNHVTIGADDNNMPECLEFFPDQLRIMYQGRSGYLYTCENNGNITVAQSASIWSSKEAVNVVNVEFIDNVYEHILLEIAATNARFVSYESLSEKTKQEYIVNMKDFILERNLLKIDSAQSRFWAQYYPEAWRMAQATTVGKYV